jgi:hypothetical protein
MVANHWSAADESMLVALQQRKERALGLQSRLYEVLLPALDKAIPRIDAGTWPAWPGTVHIADSVATLAGVVFQPED